MDEREVEEALEHLQRWGLVEERDGHLVGTRRWAAKLQAAAERLNVEAAKTGVNPPGNPLVLAVQSALAAEGKTEDALVFERAVRVLVLLELTRMPPEKRAQLGFADINL